MVQEIFSFCEVFQFLQFLLLSQVGISLITILKTRTIWKDTSTLVTLVMSTLKTRKNVLFWSHFWKAA